jgi:hypothetical protein
MWAISRRADVKTAGWTFTAHAHINGPGVRTVWATVIPICSSVAVPLADPIGAGPGANLTLAVLDAVRALTPAAC